MSKYLTENDLKSMKVFFMAGDGPDAKSIETLNYKGNKCFIPLNGRSPLNRMLDVFDDIGSKNIYVIGTEKDIKKNIDYQNVEIIDCYGKLSTKIAKITSEIDFKKDEPVLFMQGDTPLFNKRSLLEFISGCDLNKADYFHPLVPREYIDFFSPFFDRTYIFTRDIDSRVNCMTVVVPERMNFKYIQAISDYRKMDESDPSFGKDARSSTKGLISTALNAFGFMGCLTLLKFKLNSNLYRTKYQNLHKFLKKISTRDELEKYTSKAFCTRAKSVMIPYGETTIDIDSSPDAEIFEEHFDDLEKIVAEEHKFIDNLYENALILKSIRSSDSIEKLYEELKENKHPLWRLIKKDFFTFKRFIEIYSKNKDKKMK